MMNGTNSSWFRPDKEDTKNPYANRAPKMKLKQNPISVSLKQKSILLIVIRIKTVCIQMLTSFYFYVVFLQQYLITT